MKLTLPLTQPEFNATASAFLTQNGFEDNDEYKIYYGSAVQFLVSKEQDITADSIIDFIQKRRSNELAYYLIRDAVKRRQEAEDGPKATKEATEGVVLPLKG